MESQPVSVTDNFYNDGTYTEISEQRFFYVGSYVYLEFELQGLLEIETNEVEFLSMQIVSS